jgi:hypothetical protein
MRIVIPSKRPPLNPLLLSPPENPCLTLHPPCQSAFAGHDYSSRHPEQANRRKQPDPLSPNPVLRSVYDPAHAHCNPEQATAFEPPPPFSSGKSMPHAAPTVTQKRPQPPPPPPAPPKAAVPALDDDALNPFSPACGSVHDPAHAHCNPEQATAFEPPPPFSSGKSMPHAAFPLSTMTL